MTARHLERRFQVEAGEEEIATGWIWSLAPLGVEWRDAAGGTEAVAYFVADGCAPLPEEFPLALVEERTLEATDWLALWRAAASPIEVGRSLLVDPRELDAVGAPPETGGRHLLRLPARTAFGVGSHESTRLAWELAESLELAGRSVLDVGCGTGILAFGCRLAGAGRVVGFDVDPAAALLAGQYARHNALAVPFFAGRLSALAGFGAIPTPAGFDLLLVNVIPEEIRDELAALIDLLAPAGEAVFSGILEREAGAAAAELARHGLVERERRIAGEWAALRVARAGAAGRRP